MAKRDENGFWIDGRGTAIPMRYIDPHVKKRDSLVEKLSKKAFALNKKMISFRKEVEELILEYVNELRESHNLSDNWKGNLTLTGFSSTLQIEVDVKDLIVFDDRLSIAKGLIDKYLSRQLKDSNNNALKAIIHEAFNMDKSGQVNRYQLKRLCKLKISDTDWQKAVELITDAETAIGSKRYIVFKFREERDQKWKTLNLNFSTL